MNEHAKQKLADFLDKEVADKEIVIADLIDKVYDFAVSVERGRCLDILSIFRASIDGIGIDDVKYHILNGVIHDDKDGLWINVEDENIEPKVIYG